MLHGLTVTARRANFMAHLGHTSLRALIDAVTNLAILWTMHTCAPTVCTDCVQAVKSATCQASNTDRPTHIRHQQHEQQPEQLPVRPAPMTPTSHLQEQQCQWWKQTAAAASAAVFAASAVLCPVSVPAASAHDNMDHQQLVADKMSSK